MASRKITFLRNKWLLSSRKTFSSKKAKIVQTSWLLYANPIKIMKLFLILIEFYLAASSNQSALDCTLSLINFNICLVQANNWYSQLSNYLLFIIFNWLLEINNRFRVYEID